MGKFKEEIIALNTSASAMSDEEFNQKVLAAVAAHLADATHQEESYYTHLAKFELTLMPKILATPTVISFIFGSDVDPLQEVREKNALLQKQLLESLEACVVEIKSKMEKQAVSLEKIAQDYETTIAENKKEDSSSKNSGEYKLSPEALETLKKSAGAFRLNAKETREQAILYDTYKKQLESFLQTPSTTLSKEALILLGQLRRYLSTTENLPKSFADWNAMTVKALSSPKSNATVITSITSLLTAINSYQAAAEKMMRDRMVERTTVNDFQQIVSHISKKATEINEQKEAVEKKASTAQDELLNALKASREAADRLKAAEEKLKIEQENAKKIPQVAPQSHVTLSQVSNNLGMKPFNDTGSVQSFATFKTFTSKKASKGLIESNPITDGQNMIKYAGWTQSRVVLLQNLRLQYNLEMYNEATGKGTILTNSTTNGHTHRDFVGKGETLSEKMFSFIEALADETATPLQVVEELNNYYANLEVTKNLAGVEDTAFQDIEQNDKVPGFTISNKTAQNNIKMMYYKISMLFNMWSDDDNTSMLPYNAVKAEKYGKMALEMENNYPFLDKNRNEKLITFRAVNQ